MAESSQELSRPTKKPEPKDKLQSPGRREFMIGLAGLSLLAILGRLLRDKSERQKKDSPGGSSANLGRAVSRKLESERERNGLAFDKVFGKLQGKEKDIARSIVDQMKQEVLYPHPSFEGMLAVTNTFQPQIKEAAEKFGIPTDLASGIVFIENGGGVDKTSREGARGPAQLMVETAKDLDLIVDLEKGIDERLDPEKSFDAMCRYLVGMRGRFGGNLGISIWGYHAGEGNIYDALRSYFKDEAKVDLGDIRTDSMEEAQRLIGLYSQKIKESGINVHQLLSNEAVKRDVLAHLADETELYVYKAVGGAEIVQEAQEKDLASGLN